MSLARGASSKWAAYVATLPETLDAPLFWTSEQLAELQGTQLLQNAAGYDSYVRGTYQARGEGVGGPGCFTLHTSHSFSFVRFFYFTAATHALSSQLRPPLKPPMKRPTS